MTSLINWQSVFFVNIPIGIICLILTAALVEESYDNTAGKRIDWLGMLTLSVAMFTLTLGLIQANDMGWTSTYIITLSSISVAALIAFVLVEMKVKEPMLPLSLLRIGYFNAAAITIMILGTGLICGFFILAFLLTKLLGMSVLQAGLTISAMPIASMITSSISGPLSNKFGSRVFSVIGMGLMAISAFLYSGINIDSSRFDIIWRLIIAGIGLGLTIGPVMGAAVKHVPTDKVGIASGIINMARALGMVLGVAILVSVLNANISRNLDKVKAELVVEVEASTTLDKESKDLFVKEIKEANMSSESKTLKLEDILTEADNKEKEELNASTGVEKDTVKKRYDARRAELRRIWPKIENGFVSSVSDAFSTTFRFGGLIILLGILTAFFSDNKKKNESFNEKAVNM